MNPHQHRKMKEIMANALPEMPVTPTTQSCAVESMAREVVIRQDCRRTAACALCAFSGLTCDQIVATAQIHDGFAVPERQVSIVRRNDAGFAG